MRSESLELQGMIEGLQRLDEEIAQLREQDNCLFDVAGEDATVSYRHAEGCNFSTKMQQTSSGGGMPRGPPRHVLAQSQSSAEAFLMYWIETFRKRQTLSVDTRVFKYVLILKKLNIGQQ